MQDAESYRRHFHKAETLYKDAEKRTTMLKWAARAFSCLNFCSGKKEKKKNENSYLKTNLQADLRSKFTLC